MNFIDRAQETSTTTGTGTYTTLGATFNKQLLVNAGSGKQIPYVAEDNSGAGWEVGLGTVTAGNLTRDTIFASSNAGAAVSWGAGTRTISLTFPAEECQAASASAPLSITTVGTWPIPPVISLCAPQSICDASGNVTTYRGKCADLLSLPSNNTVTSVTFDDLEGVVSVISAALLANLPTLATLSFPSLVYAKGAGFGPNLTALTTFDIPALTYIGGGFNPVLPALATLSAPSLSFVGGIFQPNNMLALTTLSVPALAYVGGNLGPTVLNALGTLSFPALTRVGSGIAPSNMASLTTLSIPVLAYVGGSLGPNSMASLTTISAPALTYIGGSISPSTTVALTTISLPAIEYLGAIVIGTATAALSSITLGSTLKAVGGSCVITSCALTQASVDGILVRLAALDGTGGTTAYSSKTVTITGTSATPSATGLAAKATLVARGCTVTTN